MKTSAKQTFTDTQKLTFTFVNSTAFYIIGFVVSYFVFNLATMGMAASLKIPVELSTSGIDFRINEKDWNRLAVTYVRFVGPLVAAVAAFIFFRLYIFRKRKPGQIKVLWLWCYFHSTNFAVGSILVGLATSTGVWFGFQAQRYSEVIQVLVAIVCVITMLVIGFRTGRMFMIAASSRTLVKEENKSRFVMFSIVAPWLLNSILFFVVRLPNNSLPDTALLITMGMMIIPIGNSYKAYSEILLVKDRKKRTFLWEYVALAIILFVTFVVLHVNVFRWS
jgi:hypothetical protein